MPNWYKLTDIFYALWADKSKRLAVRWKWYCAWQDAWTMVHRNDAAAKIDPSLFTTEAEWELYTAVMTLYKKEREELG